MEVLAVSMLGSGLFSGSDWYSTCTKKSGIISLECFHFTGGSIWLGSKRGTNATTNNIVNLFSLCW